MSAKAKQTFSRGRKWSIGFQVGLLIFVIFSIVVMLNYLSAAYFHRFHASTTLKNELSPQTVRFVRSMTNDVKVTIYYDREEPFFTTVQSLLKEYRYLNPRISIETVDYLRDPVAAERVKAQFKQFVFPTTTNLVIFETPGKRVFPVDGNALTKYTLEQVPNEKERVFQRRAVAFEGEKIFTSVLLALSNPKPLNAYFLEGHGENSILSNDTNTGYSTFAALVQQNYIQPRQVYSLLGNNALPDPTQCNLLVIAGPNKTLYPSELDKIDRYLAQGGRLLALFNSRDYDPGFEGLLRKWGVDVSSSVIKDPSHSTDPARAVDVITSTFMPHPITTPLLARDWSMEFYNPRPVSKIQPKDSPNDTLKVQEIVRTSPDAFLEEYPERKRDFPLVVAAEKTDAKGIASGSTKILVAGDSMFLGNQLIESAANRDFAGFALNWLLDRTQLLEGIGPRGITRNQLLVPARQMVRAEWLLLGGMPGSALVLGGLVWLRRRK